ncbi:MAG: hypothetical protein ABIH63_01070 [archaeon]
MKVDLRLILLITIFTIGIFFINQYASYTGYAVAEPSVSIELEKTKYLPGEKLQGLINITFQGNVEKGSEILLDLEGKKESLPLTDYLVSTNTSYKATAEEITVTNPSSTKNLSLSAGQETQIGLKLPAMATIDSIQMAVTGSASNPTRLLSLDVPESSEKPEWKYMGPFLNKYGPPVYPEGLDIQSQGSIQYLDKNTTYYCQLIDLPYAKNYQIGANYAAVTEGTAALDAVILSFDGAVAYGGAQNCTLPRGSTVKAWQTCNIALGQGIQWYYMVCLKLDKQERSYEISRDDNPATTKYNCEIGLDSSWGYAFCMPIDSRNYYIRIAPGEYNDNLTGVITTQQFSNWFTDISFQDSLTSYLESCQPDNIGDCPVPITVKSESNGYAQLSNLRIEYTEYGGGSSYTSSFYDISVTIPEIYEIRNKGMNNTKLSIPLSFFNVTTPNVTKKQTADVYVSFAGAGATEEIIVYSTETPEEFGEVDELIQDAKDKLNKIKLQEISWILNVEDEIQQLANYQTQVNNIKNMNISLEEKEGQLADIKDEIEAYVNSLPDTATKMSETKDTQIVNPSDVEELVTEDAEEIFKYQDKANINVAVKTYKVTNQDGSAEIYSIITKTISPKASMTDVYVYEVIPKTIAQSVSDITFEKPTFEVVMEDPIVKFYYQTLGSTTITYAVKSLVTQQAMYQLKTVIVPKKMPVEIPQGEEYVCGDGKCSKPQEDEIICPKDCGGRKIPWLGIIIIIALLIFAILYLNFYRGKFSLGKIARKKSPFKSEKDLEAVKNYIKDQLKNKVKKKDIAKALLEKGWTKEQVEYAFDDMEWDKKREETMRKAPTETQDMKKLVAYIQLCKRLNIKDDKITQSLKAKGWKDNVIKEGLAKATHGQTTAIQTAQSKPTGKKEKEQKAKPFFEQKGL